MIPINPLGFLVSSTLYNIQKIPHSWTTPQLIPHTWESSSIISHLDFFSQKFTNKNMKYSHKILVQNLDSNNTR